MLVDSKDVTFTLHVNGHDEPIDVSNFEFSLRTPSREERDAAHVAEVLERLAVSLPHDADEAHYLRMVESRLHFAAQSVAPIAAMQAIEMTLLALGEEGVVESWDASVPTPSMLELRQQIHLKFKLRKYPRQLYALNVDVNPNR